MSWASGRPSAMPAPARIRTCTCGTPKAARRSTSTRPARAATGSATSSRTTWCSGRCGRRWKLPVCVACVLSRCRVSRRARIASSWNWPVARCWLQACWWPPTVPLRRCAVWPASVRVAATTRSARWWRTSPPNARMRTRRGSVSCRAGRWRCCLWLTGAARSCGRCPRPRRGACWRWTSRLSSTSLAWPAIFGWAGSSPRRHVRRSR